ncbi:glycosyl hydrolase [Nocardioides conyzicola]|uniref:GH26 domain-containing protein n=1 Tax=Nocardioides conyzicola TaxID=1651781 RepID=A0ABP8Y024_9ACTN
MQRWGAVRLALIGLLAGGSIVSGATLVAARPHHPAQATLAVRIGPTTVPVGEPATLTSRLRPAKKGVRLVVQRRVSGHWVTQARPTTDAQGRASYRVRTSAAGVQKLRVLRTSSHRTLRATSRVVTLKVTATSACIPRTPLVDPAADRAARCLAARLDRWQSAGAMGIGQQLNVSNAQYAAPLDKLGRRSVGVVGLDLKELVDSEGYAFPVRPLDYLSGLAQQGAVLSVSWHPDNPGTAARYDDRSWTDLESLVAPSDSAAKTRFWADFDAGMQLFSELQDDGVAVVFRPLHEANGDWFWWGRPHATTYRQLWTAMQDRAAGLGVHNVLWAYSFNADTGTNTSAPVGLLPTMVDLAGMDSYSRVGDALSTAGYAAVAAKVSRMAFTEVGPYQTSDATWDPAVVTRAARGLTHPPLWSMFWVDDGTGIKQLSSLKRAPAWMDSCKGGFCTVGP